MDRKFQFLLYPYYIWVRLESIEIPREYVQHVITVYINSPPARTQIERNVNVRLSSVSGTNSGCPDVLYLGQCKHVQPVGTLQLPNTF